MIRKVYIIPKHWEVDEDVAKVANQNGCSEIAQGIPKRFASQISEESLPLCFEEVTPDVKNEAEDLATLWKDASTDTEKLVLIAQKLGLE